MSYVNNVDGDINATDVIGTIKSIVTKGNITTVSAIAKTKINKVIGKLGISQIIEKDYNNFENKPSINNVILEGNKTAEDLGLQPKGNYADKNEIPIKTSQLENDSGFLKEHQDLSKYAKKDDIPDVSDFITKDVAELTNFYDKTEIDKIKNVVNTNNKTVKANYVTTDFVETNGILNSGGYTGGNITSKGLIKGKEFRLNYNNSEGESSSIHGEDVDRLRRINDNGIKAVNILTNDNNKRLNDIVNLTNLDLKMNKMNMYRYDKYNYPTDENGAKTDVVFYLKPGHIYLITGDNAKLYGSDWYSDTNLNTLHVESDFMIVFFGGNSHYQYGSDDPNDKKIVYDLQVHYKTNSMIISSMLKTFTTHIKTSEINNNLRIVLPTSSNNDGYCITELVGLV